jgi:hypothetical protein
VQILGVPRNPAAQGWPTPVSFGHARALPAHRRPSRRRAAALPAPTRVVTVAAIGFRECDLPQGCRG